MVAVRAWDTPDGDAQYLEGVEDNTYDFAVSSHSLEHMVDVDKSLRNWIRVVKPGGYIIIAVPDEEMYERNRWPSIGNADHKWSFTVKTDSTMPKSINVLDLVKSVGDVATLEKIELIDEFFVPGWDVDQTKTTVTECAIEIVLRKK
jgi:ubiquinone/menaquinone biosynthesis C-methylase UbiE